MKTQCNTQSGSHMDTINVIQNAGRCKGLQLVSPGLLRLSDAGP
eukprot:CAMPEP_0167794990 /NCGR_PEP_ID=MMETSP0111_2-20121227/14168_1 /TAXON_ID=91324 /ORGANISM="Lotharella globosa, Strain CCCM811" /LENGTH=43 /DNA_ID= /DNA_START= /DNA_END= /DNA_ORIENTATION=